MTSFPDLFVVPPSLLALGEPAHGESAFAQLRNEAFAWLAERGYRSIVLQSDRAAALIADEFVQGSATVTLERALTEGLGPELGAAPANRDLLVWMRAWNSGRPASERLTLYGFDAPPADAGVDRLVGARDAVMAENLLAIRSAEADRGPTLVFGHNRHLQRTPRTKSLTTTAGTVVAARLGDRYAVIIGSLGAGPALGIEASAPSTDQGEPSTYEGELSTYQGEPSTDQGELSTYEGAPSTYEGELQGSTGGPRYVRSADVERADAVLHVPTGVDAAMLADRILALPGTEQLVAGEENGAPEAAWGDRFFTVGPDRRQPFATIVEHDVPGFDEASQLDRPGVFRLNLDLGRAAFERLFGFPPKDFEAHRDEFDYARLDSFMPHPGYALYGFGSIVMPGPHLLPEIDRLLAIAHGRAADRHDRAVRRAAEHDSGPVR
jgi:hypothetical protein